VRRVVIVGAGFAGLTLASELEGVAKAGLARVTMIDGGKGFQMGLSAQFALAGRRKPTDGHRGFGKLKATHVHFINEHATAIDTAARVVRTDRGDEPFDDLIIATGAEGAPQLVPGLSETAHNLCDVDSVMKMKEELERVRSGTVAILVAAVPFKCPPAPYEYALLIDEILAERGVRNRFSIVLATPEPQPVPAGGKEMGDALRGLLEAKGITLRFQQKVKHVAVAERTIHFEAGQTLEFTVFGAMPPLRAPEVVRASGLCDASGLVPVDLRTFQTSVKDVYAVGDVASIKLPDGRPHPKAGVFAEGQASAVAGAISARLEGGVALPYAGVGTCFLDVGHGEAAPAEINLLGEGGPKGKMGAPSKEGLAGKVAFEAERLARWFD
jgi:sulfide:quinone oxidoreductase